MHALARLALELRSLVREIRRDVAVADDQVGAVERRDELRPRMQPVARVEQRRELRVHLVESAELAVQVVADRETERVPVVARKAEGGDGVARGAGGVGEERGLRPLAGAVDPFDREQEPSHPGLGYEADARDRHRRRRLHRLARRDALLARGDEVHVLDDLSKGKRENVAAGAELHVADIRDPDAVFDAVRPEAVVHLAAQADVRVSVERPDFDADVNVLGTIRILEAARRHGAKVVFASSGGAGYGECDGPAPETAPMQPLAPYGTSKLAGEEYLAT